MSASNDKQRDSKHVLVVNDTEEILELFREIIEGMGHRVTAISFAPSELQDVRKVKPDLVIADFMVGGEGKGWQLVQKMRMSLDTAKIPIVVCSAAVMEIREQEGWLLSQGITVVLKPFQVDDLEAAIRKALTLPDVVNP